MFNEDGCSSSRIAKFFTYRGAYYKINEALKEFHRYRRSGAYDQISISTYLCVKNQIKDNNRTLFCTTPNMMVFYRYLGDNGYVNSKYLVKTVQISIQ